MHRVLTYVILIQATTAFANNNLFLPGDAFFPTALTADALQDLSRHDAAKRTFRYSSFGEYEGAFCGYAGYEYARVEAVDDAFFANLKKAYQIVRSDHPRQLQEIMEDEKPVLIETNPVRVLFYAESFSFPERELGLRYNENWVDEVIKFGHAPEQVRLCELVNNSDAVGTSWRDVHRVAGIAAQLPTEAPGAFKSIKTPVVIQGPIKAIVTGPRPFADFFEANPLAESLYGEEVLIVNSKGITRLSFAEDGRWHDADSKESDEQDAAAEEARTWPDMP